MSFSQEAQESVSATAVERFALHGTSCVVTGGTKGIGFAIVNELAKLGAQVRNACSGMLLVKHADHHGSGCGA